MSEFLINQISHSDFVDSGDFYKSIKIFSKIAFITSMHWRVWLSTNNGEYKEKYKIWRPISKLLL